MEPKGASGVSGSGKKWIAACQPDEWLQNYTSKGRALQGYRAHEQSKKHRENGNAPSAMMPSAILESGPISEPVAPSFQQALKALADARAAYEDSLNAFLRMIGD